MKVGCRKPPDPSFTKQLNTDKALFADLQYAGINAILQNSDGDVLMATSMKERAIQNFEIVESLAILRGLSLCIHLGISQLIIESDWQFVVHALQDPTASYSPLGNIFEDIKAFMARF